MLSTRKLEKAVLGAAFFVALLAFAQNASAEGQFLDGPAIEALLNDTRIVSADDAEPWSQTFSASGATLYTNPSGEQSSGAWGVQGNRYCSLWPPSNSWDCYFVRTETVDGAIHIVWVTNSGFETVGIVVSD